MESLSLLWFSSGQGSKFGAGTWEAGGGVGATEPLSVSVMTKGGGRLSTMLGGGLVRDIESHGRTKRSRLDYLVRERPRCESLKLHEYDNQNGVDNFSL